MLPMACQTTLPMGHSSPKFWLSPAMMEIAPSPSPTTRDFALTLRRPTDFIAAANRTYWNAMHSVEDGQRYKLKTRALIFYTLNFKQSKESAPLFFQIPSTVRQTGPSALNIESVGVDCRAISYLWQMTPVLGMEAAPIYADDQYRLPAAPWRYKI